MEVGLAVLWLGEGKILLIHGPSAVIHSPFVESNVSLSAKEGPTPLPAMVLVLLLLLMPTLKFPFLEYGT